MGFCKLLKKAPIAGAFFVPEMWPTASGSASLTAMLKQKIVDIF